MPSSNVSWPVPLTRLTPWYPGQLGVPGTDSERGLRLDSNGCIFYVDPNHVDANDNRDGTNPDSPLQTVATALTKCQAYRGDVIAVMASNTNPYANAALGRATAIQETVTVTVPGVRIVGVCPSSSIGVVWASPSAASTCITIYANDVCIEGFFFAAAGRAIYAEYDGTSYFGDYTTVRNCFFDGSNALDVGIQLEYTWYCDIHHNVFLELDDYGIYADVAGSSIAYCHIHDNVFHDNDAAMVLLGGCDDNVIWANSIYNNDANSGAVATNLGIDLTGGRRNMVTNNWFSCLLPVPANGDWNDFNTGNATDCWAGNWCKNGVAVTTP